MKELDFSIASIVIEDNLIFIYPIKETINIKVDRSAILINDISTEKDITANYSLIVFGNVNASNIKIKQDLVCFGTVRCDTLHVSGSVKCFKDLYSKEVYIGKDAYVNSGMIESNSTVKGNLIVGQTLEVNNGLCVSKNIICNEGIIGSGKVECTNIVASEYIEINALPQNRKIILGETIDEKFTIETSGKNQIESIKGNVKESSGGIENKITRLSESLKNEKKNIVLELNNIIYDKELMNFIEIVKGINDFAKDALEDLISVAESEMEFEKIGSIISSSSFFNPLFKEHYIVFKQILDWSEKRPERNIASFLKSVDLKRQTPGYIAKISICKDFFNTFIEKEKNYINEMSVSNIKDHQQFIYNLTLLEQNRNQFSEDEYMLILEKLYSVIGIKPTMIKKFISIGG